MKNIRVSELSSLIKSQPIIQLIDVRTPQEYNAGHIDGFVNVPLDDLMQSSEVIDFEHPIVVMCHAGSRSLIACRTLEIAGHNDVYNLAGGYLAF